MEDTDDPALLRAFRSGDLGAFEALVERHQAPLLRHARALLGGRAEAEDVVQEVFLKLVPRPPEIAAGGAAGDGRLAAWLHTVTRNACMDVTRREGRRRRREETSAVPEAIGGGIDRVESADTRSAVERGLDRLTGDQREVLTLRLLNDRSYREIAEITGKKVGTVGWLVSTGLKALAADLAPLLEGTPIDGARIASRPRQAGGLHGEQA
jgi:RNA polymerase sigma-70 factor (ECF subfamily)